MKDLIPEGTVLDLDGLKVTVGVYSPTLDCYRVSYAGPGHIASAGLLEAAWREQQPTRGRLRGRSESEDL